MADAVDLLAGTIYRGGQCRGDTPPRDFKTTGAACVGRIHPKRLEEMRKGRPYHSDETLQCPARHMGMNLNVLTTADVPPGPIRYPKDHDRMLTTEDIPLAQPALAHPSTATTMPIPWKCFQKSAPEVVAKSTPRMHYPAVSSNRPRDLSLTAADIDYAQPKKIGGTVEGRRRDDIVVNPLPPSYPMQASSASADVAPRKSGRCSLDTSDIEGTKPTLQIPVRSEYGDPMKCEIEFRSKARERTHADALARAKGERPRCTSETSSFTPRTGTVQAETMRRRMERPADGLIPKYKVAQVKGTPGTSLHARWSEEKETFGDAPPETVFEEIGHIEGTQPKCKIRDNGEHQRNLETMDVEGAQTMTRIGRVPYSIYGPQGNRPLHPNNINTTNIEGAQAGTLRRYPRVPPRVAQDTSSAAESGPATPRLADATSGVLRILPETDSDQATIRLDDPGQTLRLEPELPCTSVETG